MRNIRILLLFAVVLFVFSDGVVFAQPAQKENAGKLLYSNPDDEKTIRRLSKEFVAAFRLNNPTPITRLEEIFADDFCQISMSGEVIRGKQDNLSYYRQAQQKKRLNWKSYAVRYEIQSVKISCDLAVVFGRVEGEGRHKNVPKPIGREFMETLVFQRIDGKWRLVQEHSTGIKKRAEDSKAEESAAEEIDRTQGYISSSVAGSDVGMKKEWDENERPAISRSISENQDEAAIRALVDKINQAWLLEKPSTIFQEILSDKGFVVAIPKPNNPSQAAVIDKQRFCEALDRIMQDQNRPQKHEHTVESIMIIGPFAYEIGALRDISANGTESHSEVMNIFAKDETGWKLIQSISTEDARKALESSPSDEEAVRRFAQEYTAVFRIDKALDVGKLEKLFDDNFFVITSQGRFIQGKQNVISAYLDSWKEVCSELQTFKISFDIDSVELTGNTAVIFGKVEMEGRMKNTSEPFNRCIWETLIFRKISGQWRIIQEHSTAAAPVHDVGNVGKQKLSVEQTRKFKQDIQSSFSGIGVHIDTHPDGILVKRVVADGPADNAGLNAGDVITAIDGQSTRGMSLEQAIKLIKGPEETSVKLEIRSESGAGREANVVRGTVVISGVESRIIEPDIGLLAITDFTKQTPAEVRKAIKNFQKQDVRGLIVDLRENNGGFYSAVLEVAGMFVGQDRVMWQIQNVGQNQPNLVKGTHPKMVRLPVVALISSKTKSGGELMACALRTSGGAKLLGQTTAGKGFSRSWEKKANGTSEKTIAAYLFTADGQPINKRGIRPDRWISPGTSPEEVLKRALSELTGG